MNTFSAIGRIGRDATLRNAGAKKVLSFSVAVDTGWGDRKTTTWLDCSLWGERGEKLAEYIVKGDRIGVTGEMGSREHEGKTYVTLDVRDVTLLGSKGEAGSGGTRGGAPQRERPTRVTDPQPASDFADDDIPFVRADGRF